MSEQMKSSENTETTSPASHFIQDIITEDLKNNKNEGRVHTRFPPEPNGYLHIGHAKSICLNFGLAEKNSGLCNLRFDDTNPTKEDVEYVDSIQEDVRWLGFDWDKRIYYASDYFDKFYTYALQLIRSGKAYVCSLTEEEMKEYRGTVSNAGSNDVPKPGKESPYRNRSVEENLTLFEEMRQGKYKDGEHVLRAKIDINSPNLNLRDPIIYRIKQAEHHRTGNRWCIYPMYDYAHCLSDSIERITHSICTLEFENHRPLYDWFLDELQVPCHPQQIEFARLNLTYTVLSKRRLLQLVQEKIVNGWDDPRMPTLAGLRRRGYTPSAIRTFCERIGVAKTDSTIDIALLEYCLREDLNKQAQRVMAVLNPLKVVIDNYPEGKVEELDAENNPEDLNAGSRKIPFSREIYIERDDFKEDPPKKFFRLSLQAEVRLKHAYYITCTEVVKDKKTGEIIELHATYDPATKGGWSQDGRKVKGTLHWVSAEHSVPAKIRLYDHLFLDEYPGLKKDFKESINPNSLSVLDQCRLEPGLKKAQAGVSYQFLRQGYFCLDAKDSKSDTLIFNRTVPLRDSWAKIEKKG